MKRFNLPATVGSIFRFQSATAVDVKLTLVSSSEQIGLSVCNRESVELVATVATPTATQLDLADVSQFELKVTSGSGQLKLSVWTGNNADFTCAVQRYEDTHQEEFLDYNFLQSSSSSVNSSSSSTSSNSSSSSVNSSSSSSSQSSQSSNSSSSSSPSSNSSSSSSSSRSSASSNSSSSSVNSSSSSSTPSSQSSSSSS